MTVVTDEPVCTALGLGVAVLVAAGADGVVERVVPSTWTDGETTLSAGASSTP
ncbi:hypothetical protein IF650_11140 [Cellulosimicrobium terreum]|nr:hypothetical protein [Cellulosimicrobium terreum]